MNSALTGALSSVCPSEEQTLLLRACLASGASGQDAWAKCRERIPDLIDHLRRDSLDARRLAPLLYVALRDHAEEADRALLTVLRTAYMREELRSKEYRRVVGDVLSALTRAGVAHIVFRGAALGETVYESSLFRHSHDLNLLLPPDQQATAAAALRRNGCVVRKGAKEADALILSHESQLPVLLHNRFFRVSLYQMDWQELWTRSREGIVAGRPVRLLDPTSTLLHSCAQAFLSVRPGAISWACDSYLAIKRSRDLDWGGLLALATRTRTALLLAVALRYLADTLEAPVPADLLGSLDEATREAVPVERDVAILAARRRRRGASLVNSKAPTTLRDRLLQLRWLLVPSAEYLRWAYRVRHPALLPLYYLKRLGRYAARRTRGRRYISSAPTPPRLSER